MLWKYFLITIPGRLWMIWWQDTPEIALSGVAVIVMIAIWWGYRDIIAWRESKRANQEFKQKLENLNKWQG